MAEPVRLRITVEDLATGERQSQTITDDYIITVCGPVYVAHISAYASGTHVITVKGLPRRGPTRHASYDAPEPTNVPAGEHASPAPRGPRNIHLITASFGLACGHDGHDDASSVPAEVTCPSCKLTLAGRMAGGA